MKYALFVNILIILGACSVQEHFDTLSFFFDGVPSSNTDQSGLGSDSLKIVSDSSMLSTSEQTPTLFVHQPYLKKQCALCHNKGQMGNMTEAGPELCYQCHLDFTSRYNFSHGPVLGGYCSECHNPHKSEKENLLKLTGSELCFQCHSPDQIFESVFHERENENTCSYCHNSHGSNNIAYLVQGACYECHEDYNKTHIVVHGPVESGMCSACHTSHSTGINPFMLSTGKYLCFNCHDERMIENEPHSDIGDMDCLECHNPHGGEDKFMFN